MSREQRPVNRRARVVRLLTALALQRQKYILDRRNGQCTDAEIGMEMCRAGIGLIREIRTGVR